MYVSTYKVKLSSLNKRKFASLKICNNVIDLLGNNNKKKNNRATCIKQKINNGFDVKEHKRNSSPDKDKETFDNSIRDIRM